MSTWGVPTPPVADPLSQQRLLALESRIQRLEEHPWQHLWDSFVYWIKGVFGCL